MRPPQDPPPRPPGDPRREPGPPGPPGPSGPPARSGRGRTWIIAVVAVLFLLVSSLRGIASFATDAMWFDSLGLSGVWRGLLGAKVLLAVVAGATMAALVWLNMALADRFAPVWVGAGRSPDDVTIRYRQLMSERSTVVRAVVALAIAGVGGAAAAGHWEEWLLFANRVDFGQSDATYGLDIGFYVFQLPFLRFATGWLFSALVVVLALTTLVHVLNGGIRFQPPEPGATPQVKAHLSVLMGSLALVRAVQYWLDRYELVYSTRGAIDGATYTDVKVQQTSLTLMVVISITAAVLFLVNIRRRGWVLPVLGVGLWALVHLLAVEAVPAFVQRVRVKPSESAKEAPYIRQNIRATRLALGLDDVSSRAFAADGELDGAGLIENTATVQNIRLWDPAALRQTFQRLQGIRDFYVMPDVDVDRYEIDGEVVQTMISARELNRAGIPQESWERSHLRFTHGYGAVMAPANAKTADGSPDLLVRDIPVASEPGAPEVTQPSLYIGEQQSGYVITNTERPEILSQDASGQTSYASYEGRDGVELSSFLRRAAFALRFGDVDPMISDSVTSESRVLLHRELKERLHAVAPFLALDADPYLVVVDGRLQYIVDAYTSTDRYPNAQRVPVDDLSDESGLRTRLNYVRNSVKAVVDAYDGTVKLYVVDDEDPIIRAWRKAFPELFTDGDEVPEELAAHFRYPEDLFRVQTSMWGRYHVSDPDTFYSGNDEWSVAASAGQERVVPTPVTASTTVQGPPLLETGRSERFDPTYLLMRLPGEEEESFLLLRPMVPISGGDTTGQLTAFLVAKPDGTVEQFEMPADRLPDGPSIAASRMQQDEGVASLQTLLGQEGSELTFGNVVMVPIEQSMLYIRPMYVTADVTKVPQIKRVIVSFQDGPDSNRVAVAETLDEALRAIFGTSPGTLEEPVEGEEPTGEPGEEPTGEPGEEPPAGEDLERALLVRRLNQAFDEADAALRAGDAVAWAEAIREAQLIARRLEDIDEAEAEADGDGSDSSTTTTTTAPGSTTSTAPP